MKLKDFYPIEETKFTRLLGAYSGSLGKKDRKLLAAIRDYEVSGKVNFQKYFPILWGESANEAYSKSEKVIGTSLWNRPTETDLLNSLDGRILWRTVMNFPLKLSSLERETQLKSEDAFSRKIFSDESRFAGHDLYDPEFLLNVFASILRPECIVECRKFIDMNCLALAFAALSSGDGDIRALAYLVLGRFLNHLVGTQESNFQERPQFLYLLNLVKNSVPVANQRLSCIITHFLARTSKLFLHPEDSCYVTVSHFLLAKPTLELDHVPEFYIMLHSEKPEPHHTRRDRMWLLTLLSESVRTGRDYHIIERRYGFKLLLGYFDCALANNTERILILKTLLATVKIQKAAVELSRTYNIFGWLASSAASLETWNKDKTDIGAERRNSYQDIKRLLLECFIGAWLSITKMKEDADEDNDNEADSKSVPGNLPPLVYLNIKFSCVIMKANFGEVKEIDEILAVAEEKAKGASILRMKTAPKRKADD